MTCGLLTGTLNMMNPKAVYIPNGEPGPGFEGIDGVIAAVLSTSVLGTVIGILGVFIALLFKYSTKKISQAPTPLHEAAKSSVNIGDKG